MPTYIAMLRGINVSGQKIIKMDRLRALFEALGFSGVKTYVQSGNVVFAAGKSSMGSLAAMIQKQILAEFGFVVPVLVKTAGDLARVIRDNPLLKQKSIDESKLHVTFLSATTPKTAVERLKSLVGNSEQFSIGDEEIYLYCPDGYGNTKISNHAIEKKLGLEATTRNWKSVNALLALARAQDTP